MTFEAAYVKTEVLPPTTEEFSPACDGGGGCADDSVAVKREMIFIPESVGMKLEDEEEGKEEEEEEEQQEEGEEEESLKDAEDVSSESELSGTAEDSASPPAAVREGGQRGAGGHASPTPPPPPRERDEFDLFGLSVAAKLREMSRTHDTQRIIAEKLISEILFYAQLQKLSRDTRVGVPRHSAERAALHNGDDASIRAAARANTL